MKDLVDVLKREKNEEKLKEKGKDLNWWDRKRKWKKGGSVFRRDGSYLGMGGVGIGYKE